MASGNSNNRKIQNILRKQQSITEAVNKYSQELLKSIEEKSFTQENIKNMLLTNARILSLLSGMVSKFANKNQLDGLSEQINEVQTKLNEKLKTKINKNNYNKHIHNVNISGTSKNTSKPKVP